MKTGKTQTVSRATIFSNPIHFLAFGFGSGLSPVMPGTLGTVVAIPVFLVLSQFPLWAYLLVTAVVSVTGVWICGASSRLLGVHDHGGIVWDEIAGFLITMIAAPPGWEAILLGFILFRLFDIIKPWPISYLDKHVDGGLGIMLDDIVAGVFALVSLQIVLKFI